MIMVCIHQLTAFPLKLFTAHFFGIFWKWPLHLYQVIIVLVFLKFDSASLLRVSPQFLNEHGCILIHDTHVFVIIIEVRNSAGGAFGKYMRSFLFQIFYYFGPIFLDLQVMTV